MAPLRPRAAFGKDGSTSRRGARLGAARFRVAPQSRLVGSDLDRGGGLTGGRTSLTGARSTSSGM